MNPDSGSVLRPVDFRIRPLDEVAVEGVRVHGKHGVFEEEKRDGHEFVVDAVMRLDARSAGVGDALDRSVSYADAAQIIEDVVAGPSVDLIETLAERIAQRITLEHVLVRGVRVSVHKPSAPIPQRFSNARVSIERSGSFVDAYVAFGSNLGNSPAILADALSALSSVPNLDVVAVSPVYETEPASTVEQDSYLNAVAHVRTLLSPWQLLEALQQIEQAADRVRDVRWGPRTLDLDLIAWGEIQLDDPALTLPHPRAAERAFVVKPLVDVAPDFRFAGRGSAVDLLAVCADVAGFRPGPEVRGFGHSRARVSGLGSSEVDAHYRAGGAL